MFSVSAPSDTLHKVESKSSLSCVISSKNNHIIQSKSIYGELTLNTADGSFHAVVKIRGEVIIGR